MGRSRPPLRRQGGLSVTAAVEESIAGGCFCGAVRYLARGAPINCRVCHCRMCQKAVGAAFNARLLMPAAAVTVTGPVARFATSPGLRRGFCPHCGSTVFTERASGDALGLTCGSLDRPEQFRPTEHIWTDSRQPWLILQDGLPQHRGAAP